MKSYLTIVTLCFVLVIVVFVGHHLDTPGRADRERSTLLGGGDYAMSKTGAVVAEGVDGLLVANCTFLRLGGNAVVLHGFVRRARVQGVA